MDTKIPTAPCPHCKKLTAAYRKISGLTSYEVVTHVLECWDKGKSHDSVVLRPHCFGDGKDEGYCSGLLAKTHKEVIRFLCVNAESE